jgi:hypothetical protein
MLDFEFRVGMWNDITKFLELKLFPKILKIINFILLDTHNL